MSRKKAPCTKTRRSTFLKAMEKALEFIEEQQELHKEVIPALKKIIETEREKMEAERIRAKK